jgi:hypothetical protein
MDTSTDINNLLTKFLDQVMDITWQRYESLPKQRQQELKIMYDMYLMDYEVFPLPYIKYESFKHFLSNILMKKKEHNFRKWLEEQGYQTKTTGAGPQFKVISHENKQASF